MPQKRIKCKKCAKGSYVLVGLHDDQTLCPKCGSVVKLGSQHVPKSKSLSNSGSRKSAARSSQREKTRESSNSTRLIPEAQANRVRNLLANTKELILLVQRESDEFRFPENYKISFYDIKNSQLHFENKVRGLTREEKYIKEDAAKLKAKKLKLQRESDLAGLARSLGSFLNSSIKTKELLQRDAERLSQDIQNCKHQLAACRKVLISLQKILDSPAGKKWSFYPAAPFSSLQSFRKGEPTDKWIKISKPNTQTRFSHSESIESLDDLAQDWGWESWDQFSDTIE